MEKPVMTVRKRKVYVTKRKRKKTKKRKNPIYQKYDVDYDYMKYWKTIKFWALQNYKITLPELEMMFFLYSERIFTISQFREFNNVFSWNKQRFHSLQKKGFIKVWRPCNTNEARIYEVTFQGKYMITNIYKKLNGQEPIPTSPRRNPMFRKNAGFSAKVHAMSVLKFNAEVKERLQHQSDESNDT